MSEIKKNGSDFVGYEYKEIDTNKEKASLQMDGYFNFGWIVDENVPQNGVNGSLKLKRDRKIVNKMELTRLQRQFEACLNEIERLEHSISSSAIIYSILVGILGTAFMAGSVFAITSTKPMIVLCIILAIPGFLGWILPYFIYKQIVKKRVKIISPLIEEKYNEIYEVCERGNHLLKDSIT